MKINQKYYDSINTTPIDVQETSLGKVSIYRLSEYPTLHTAHTTKSKFTVWSNKGGNDYKLLIEEGYYEELKPLYTQTINEFWLEFYNKIIAARNKTMLTILLPIAIVLFALIFLINYVIPLDDNPKLYMTIGVFVIFFIMNKFVNAKINKITTAARDEAIDKIKEHLGESEFDALLEKQEVYVKAYQRQQYIDTYGVDDYDDEITEDGTTGAPYTSNDEVKELLEDTNIETQNEDTQEN